MKNLIKLLVITIVMASYPLLSETEIPGGEVSGTWTKANSPYHITGNIIIPDSLTLAIEPGVILKFKDQTKITVKGRLLAVGTEADSISFTKDVEKTSWFRVTFDNITINNDSSLIDHCNIQYSAGFEIDSCSKVRVSNNTFYNNYLVILCTSSSPVIINNVIIKNGAQNRGHSIIYCNQSSPTIANNYFSNNLGDETTSIFCYNYSNPLIINCTIVENCSIMGPSGIVSLNNSYPKIINCNVINNYSKLDEGGGIYCANSSAYIENCNISGNRARDGGGVYIVNNSNVIIKNCRILHNQAVYNNSTTSGGGIICNDSKVTIIGCLIENNKAKIYGAMDIGGGNVSLINSTIVNNSADDCGGISSNFKNDSNLSFQIINTIIYNNSNGNFKIRSDGKHPDFLNCFLDGGKDSIILGGTRNFNGKYENNILSHPKFAINSSSTFSLTDNSPCINSGTMDTTGLNLPELDLLGNPRIFGNRIDIGAFEYQDEPTGGAELEVNNTSIDFVQQKVFTNSHEKSLIIRNEGFKVLSLELFCNSDVFKMRKKNQSVFPVNINAVLKPAEEIEIFVIFEPKEIKNYSSVIKIFSNDSDEGDIKILLTGIGTNKSVFSGKIVKDTCWADSVYIVGDIVIPDSITLCIQPNTKIIFTDYYKIDVQGRLLAVGEEDKYITFTMSDTTFFSDRTITAGGWNGIKFINTPNTNDTSKIIYCNIQYGKALVNLGYNASGGAIYIKNFSKLIFTNNIINNNMALVNGGGIYCESATFSLANNIFENNQAVLSGGGIYSIFSILKIQNSNFNNNSAKMGAGVCFIEMTNSMINNNYFYSNSASAIRCENGYHEGNQTIILNNDISNNSGAAIHCEHCLISNNKIVENTSGLYIFSTTLINNLISKNRYEGIWCTSCWGLFLNNTICDNNGVGIILGYTSPKIRNTIIYGNDKNGKKYQIEGWDDWDDYETHPEIYFCNIDGGKKAINIFIDEWFNSGIYENNIDSDPLFTNDIENPYSLSEDSPCIDAGAPDTTGLNIPLFDIIGMPRIHAGRIDIGAIEYQGEISVKNFSDNFDIFISPNPSKGLLVIDVLKYEILPMGFEVRNILGQIVSEFSVNDVHNTIDLSNLADGHYFISSNYKGSRLTKQLMIYK